MPHLQVSIAICTYNRAAYLEDTLRDLAKQSAPSGAFEILVINNNSTDSTEQVCSRFIENHPGLSVRHLTEKKQGLSHARNRALDESAAPFVLFIDDDVFLPEDFIQQALNFIEETETPCCAGGRIHVRFDDGDPGWIPSELMPMFGLHDLGTRKKRYPANNFPRGGNMLIHKTVAKKIGGFNPELGRSGKKLAGSEEKAFFDDARKTGIELWYLPELCLTHRIGKTRLKKEYIRKQSIGIGKSEKQRLSGNILRLSGKFISELYKLAASILLALIYLFKGKVKAARLILTFRFWVLKGFLN